MDMKLYLRDLENKGNQSESQQDMYSSPEEPPQIPEAQINWMQNNPRFNAEMGYTAYVNDCADHSKDE